MKKRIANTTSCRTIHFYRGETYRIIKRRGNSVLMEDKSGNRAWIDKSLFAKEEKWI